MYNIRLQFDANSLRDIKLLSAYRDVNKKELLESLVIDGLRLAKGSGEIPTIDYSAPNVFESLSTPKHGE